MTRVLVAMSGGVDSSVAAALLVEAGHEVVGATMKLWGGASDSGCCSVADVEDARRVAQQLGIVHHVFNFTADFDAHVVAPYVDAHRSGRTPNPCIECNRHLKFDRFLRRAEQLGFDAIATGHHARVQQRGHAAWHVVRGVDAAKDQSYVLSMLGQHALSKLLLPIGAMTKAAVRETAARSALRTASKPDSQDVCFVLGTAGGRATFLGDRIPLRPGIVVDSSSGAVVGDVPAVELVTVGQRRGLVASGGTGSARYALSVDVKSSTVVVGTEEELLVDELVLDDVTWTTGERPHDGTPLHAQTSAHGAPFPVVLGRDGDGDVLSLTERRRRVAPGQTVALYDGDAVVGAGLAR